MGDYLWLFYAGLSAVAAALVSIFGKIGLQGLDANTATTVRSVVMALFLIGVMIIQRNFSHLGEVLSNRRALLYIILSGTAGALSWLFYFVALKYGAGFAGCPGRQAQYRFGCGACGCVFGRKPFAFGFVRNIIDYGRRCLRSVWINKNGMFFA